MSFAAQPYWSAVREGCFYYPIEQYSVYPPLKDGKLSCHARILELVTCMSQSMPSVSTYLTAPSCWLISLSFTQP